MHKITSKGKENLMQITIRNARLSFPKLFKPDKMPGSEGEPKYSVTLILNKEKDAEMLAELKSAIVATKRDKWGDNPPKGVKLCVRDGMEKEDMDGYGDGVVFFNASNVYSVPVVDRDRSPLTEKSRRPYSGCYVNAVVDLWAQDNQWGKRINARLKAVQFASDGEPFVMETPVDPNEAFKDIAEPGERRFEGEFPPDPDDDADSIPF
jgi:hypothetical protein